MPGGEADTVKSLDCASWGTLFLLAGGEREKARRTLEAIETYYPAQDGDALGYRPYFDLPIFKPSEVGEYFFPGNPRIEWRDFPLVWSEGTLGVALAHLRMGQIQRAGKVVAGISFIALRRLQVYIRLPQSSPPSTVFLPEGPTGSQPPFYESQKLIAWASRTSFFRYLSISVGYRNHFLGCRRLGYPEGSDSPSIRPSMLANSRRVRWLSANNNQ